MDVTLISLFILAAVGLMVWVVLRGDKPATRGPSAGGYPVNPCTPRFDRFPGRIGEHTGGMLAITRATSEQDCACTCLGKGGCAQYNYVGHTVPPANNCALYAAQENDPVMIIDPEGTYGVAKGTTSLSCDRCV